MSPKPTTFLMLAAAFLAGGLILPWLWSGPDPGEAAPATPATKSAAAETWTCAMHPQIQLPEPGLCPICNMVLVPLEAGGGELGPRTLELTPAAAALAEIATAPAERRRVARELRLVGKVAYDETRLATLTAWVGGRLERLFVDYTGVAVRPGDHMVEIYSPELFTEQRVYLEALATAERLEASELPSMRAMARATVQSARAKLRRLGLTASQIEEIERRGEPEDTVEITAPIGGIVVHKNALEGMYVTEGTQIFQIADLGRVWVLLEAYESDLAWLRYGQPVEFEVAAYPGEKFTGTVTFIDPVLDDATRTVKVRVNVENADLRLKPEMFARAVVHAELAADAKVVAPAVAGLWICPMHPEEVAESQQDCSICGMALVPATELGYHAEEYTEPPLVIPATAPLLTGKRAVVYVREPGTERPTYTGREITLGPRAGDVYVVLDGLAEGDEVVVNGAFKLDSELQIRAAPSMMYPAEDAAAETTSPEPPATRHPAPPAFRAQGAQLLNAYLSAQAALAGDDLAASSASARALDAALGRVDRTLLAGAAHAAWLEAAPLLRAAVDTFFQAGDLESRRAAFADLTRAILAAAETFGWAADDANLGVFHCPMAFDDAGADWLQPGDVAANPYFGAAMLRCGTREREVEGSP